MNKIKKFLKPTLLKIILTIVLFILAHLIQTMFQPMDYWVQGVPLPFFKAWGPCHPSETVCHSYNWFFLILNIIFWYLIAALIYLGIKKIKKGNKKILKIILIVIALLIVLVVIGYFYLKQAYEISRLPDYYRDLAKECRERGDFDCCMTSVEDMARGNYKLAPETGCPEGFQFNKFRCMGSYKWCEPAR